MANAILNFHFDYRHPPLSMIVGYQNFIFCSFPSTFAIFYVSTRASSICSYDWQCAIIFGNSQLKTRDNEGSWMFAFHLTPPFSTSNTSEASSNIISEGIVKGRIYLLQIEWKYNDFNESRSDVTTVNWNVPGHSFVWKNRSSCANIQSWTCKPYTHMNILFQSRI